MTTLVWFRDDLRTQDHEPLLAAAAEGPVAPVYVHAPAGPGLCAPGGAWHWWRGRSLAALARDLARLGSPLTLAAGPAGPALARLAAACGARAVHCHAALDPAGRAQQAAAAGALAAAGVALVAHRPDCLADPRVFANRQGGPYQVFTPFWRALAAAVEAGGPPLGGPKRLRPPARRLPGLAPGGLGPAEAWMTKLEAAWSPGEGQALRRLAAFLDGGLEGYARARDMLAAAGTSRLSPHLAHGELGARQAYHAAQASGGAGEAFCRELAWREFARHLLWHFPNTLEAPLRPAFGRFPWRDDPALVEGWRRGRTGYPVVDAGMRELWDTGFMHNRARMVAASFLVKDGLIDWRLGAAWFRQALVDYDPASNTMNWQWVAGCGADAAPFFRIFNPVGQGRRFDPDEAYVRRHVPELAACPVGRAHEPWRDRHAGWPPPALDHAAARARALEAFRAMGRRGR